MYKEHLDHGNYKNKFILAFDFIMEYKYPQVVLWAGPSSILLVIPDCESSGTIYSIQSPIKLLFQAQAILS